MCQKVCKNKCQDSSGYNSKSEKQLHIHLRRIDKYIVVLSYKRRLYKSKIRPGMVVHTCNPNTLKGKVYLRQIMRSRDCDHPDQHGETPSLLKLQKLAGHGGVCL